MCQASLRATNDPRCNAMAAPSSHGDAPTAACANWPHFPARTTVSPPRVATVPAPVTTLRCAPAHRVTARAASMAVRVMRDRIALRISLLRDPRTGTGPTFVNGVSVATDETARGGRRGAGLPADGVREGFERWRPRTALHPLYP